jgi:hypothetical protein
MRLEDSQGTDVVKGLAVAVEHLLWCGAVASWPSCTCCLNTPSTAQVTHGEAKVWDIWQNTAAQ